MASAAVSLYSLVLFVHIAAAIAAFGVTFAYPLLFGLVRRGAPRNLPFFHRAQSRISSVLVTPAATVVLLAGVYLVLSGPYDFEDPFVSGGMLIVIVLLGLEGAFVSRRGRRLAELAERDVAQAGGGEVALSSEYARGSAVLQWIGVLAGVLVLVAVFLMVTKPGL